MRRLLSLNASSLWYLRTGMAMNTVEGPHAPPSSLEVVVYETRFGRHKVFERTRDDIAERLHVALQRLITCRLMQLGIAPDAKVASLRVHVILVFQAPQSNGEEVNAQTTFGEVRDDLARDALERRDIVTQISFITPGDELKILELWVGSENLREALQLCLHVGVEVVIYHGHLDERACDGEVREVRANYSDV